MAAGVHIEYQQNIIYIQWLISMAVRILWQQIGLPNTKHSQMKANKSKIP